MRLFTSANIVDGAEQVLRGIVEISLKLSGELHQLAKATLSRASIPIRC
jgi:hypothetical protein